MITEITYRKNGIRIYINPTNYSVTMDYERKQNGAGRVHVPVPIGEMVQFQCDLINNGWQLVSISRKAQWPLSTPLPCIQPLNVQLKRIEPTMPNAENCIESRLAEKDRI